MPFVTLSFVETGFVENQKVAERLFERDQVHPFVCPEENPEEFPLS
jgi:hypothetical protein